jgi:hypothetical protein
LLGSSSQQTEQHCTEDVTQTMEGDELDMTKHIDGEQILAVSNSMSCVD